MGQQLGARLADTGREAVVVAWLLAFTPILLFALLLVGALAWIPRRWTASRVP